MRTFLFLLQFVCVACFGATYYVDNSAGSDASAGTSTGTAFKHSPGDTAATGTASSTTLSAGDTVIFKGGVSYTLATNQNILLTWNGTSGSPITYDGNSAGTWGTGKAIITDNWAANEPAGRAAMTKSSPVVGVTIKNLEFYGLGGSQTLPTDFGTGMPPNKATAILMGFSCTNVTVRDCYFHEIGYYFNQKPMDGNQSISGTGIQTTDCNGLTITNCEFQRMNIACEMQSATLKTNLTIANCKFHDSIVWCIDLAKTAQSAVENGLDIYGNTFYDYFQFDTPYWTGYNGFPHTDGIFLRCDYDFCVMTNINIHGNLFYTTNQTAGGTASIYITEGPSARVYNNIFNNAHKTRNIYIWDGPFTNGGPQAVSIFNNTMLDSNILPINMGGAGASGYRPVQFVYVTNNIFYDTATGSSNNRIIYLDDSDDLAGGTNWMFTHWNFDYNCYLSFNTLGQFYQSVTNSQAGGLPTMNTHGWELHGTTNNPAFLNITAGSGTSCTNNDYHLTSSSSAKGAAFTLSSIFTTDFSGSSRTVPWDMGAYAFVSDPAITAQPQNQTVAAGQTATFSVTATTASPPLTYQWTKNGSNIASATQSTYTTPATSCPDNGSLFAVVVANALSSSVTSINATLTVTGCQGTVTNYASQIGKANIGSVRF